MHAAKHVPSIDRSFGEDMFAKLQQLLYNVWTSSPPGICCMQQCAAMTAHAPSAPSPRRTHAAATLQASQTQKKFATQNCAETLSSAALCAACAEDAQ
eukprot:365148-Chlamydomonas_euryale.AAC.8